MLGSDCTEAMHFPILLQDFLTFLDCLRRSPSSQKAVSSYFDEVLNEKPVGDSKVYNFRDWFSIQNDGIKSRVSRTREVTEVLLLDRHQFPSL